VERQHGSSEETWSQSSGQEGPTPSERGGPQRFGTQRRTHPREEEGRPFRGSQEAALARFAAK